MSLPKEESEDSLIRSAQSGDAEAFGELAEQYYDFVYRTAFKLCKSKTDAEEVTQDVFIKLARKMDSYRFDSTFQTWLYRMILNTAKDFWKKEGRLRDKIAHYVETEVDRENEQKQDKSTKSQIQQIINEMVPKLKETAFLVFTEGMSHKEAANILKCAETTISWRVFQIKKKIKQQFKPGEDNG